MFNPGGFVQSIAAHVLFSDARRIPVLEECDRRDVRIFSSQDQESSIGGDIILRTLEGVHAEKIGSVTFSSKNVFPS